jgi:hypothetical protein
VSVEQFIAILTALTALLVAVGGVFAQVRQTHELVNGKMSELVQLTGIAAKKEGELEGRDFERNGGKPL